MNSRVFSKEHDHVGTELVREWTVENPKAAFVLVHGLAEHSGRHAHVAEQLAGAGFDVRSFDLIGAGGSGGHRWHVEDWGLLHDQIADHVEWARSRGNPVVLMGHSLGGNLALGYVLSDRPAPDLLVVSAPALSGGARWQRMLAPILARLAPRLAIPNVIDGSHLSRDPAVAKRYFADPMVHTKTSAKFGALAFEAIDEVNDSIEEIDVPTYCLHGSEDFIVPTSSSEILESHPSVTRRVYEGLRHESMNEPEGPEVVADVIAWVESQLDQLQDRS